MMNCTCSPCMLVRSVVNDRKGHSEAFVVSVASKLCEQVSITHYIPANEPSRVLPILHRQENCWFLSRQ